MDFQAALPVGGGGGAMPTSEGDMEGGGDADGVADGVADGGMPWAYKGDRTRPMAEPVMRSRSQKTTVADSSLLGPQEGSLALPRVCW